MTPVVPRRPIGGRGFAAGGLIAAIAAVAAATLTACGPRDETSLSGGSAGIAPQTTAASVRVAPSALQPAPPELARMGNPVPAAQTPAAALERAPAPAYAPPPPVTVAEVPAYPTPAAGGDERAPQYAPVPAAAPKEPLPNGPPQVQPVPVAPAAAPAIQPRVVPRERIGSITAIEPVRERPQGSGAGAVIGGVLGGVIGNQFGHGLGRAAMTGVGAVGGAIAGNNVERNYKTAVVGYRVHVRLDNGSTRTFERKSIGNLHVGDRVRLDANGFHRA
jgi:outer membrane lipoprotein SlyB